MIGSIEFASASTSIDGGKKMDPEMNKCNCNHCTGEGPEDDDIIPDDEGEYDLADDFDDYDDDPYF